MRFCSITSTISADKRLVVSDSYTFVHCFVMYVHLRPGPRIGAFLLCSVVFGQLRCIINTSTEDCVKHNSWCTCEADTDCYYSALAYFDYTGNLQSYYDYGCFTFPASCPKDVEVQSLQGHPVAYRSFNCCRDEDFCNENLTIARALPISASPTRVPTPTQSVGGSWHLCVI